MFRDIKKFKEQKRHYREKKKTSKMKKEVDK